MAVRPHKNLIVWQQAMELVKDTYAFTKQLPKEEQFILVAQMRRAAISVPSNIAEGSARSTDREKANFYVIARGSLSELDTQVELCHSLKFVDGQDKDHLQERMDRVGALLNGLIESRRS